MQKRTKIFFKKSITFIFALLILKIKLNLFYSEKVLVFFFKEGNHYEIILHRKISEMHFKSTFQNTITIKNIFKQGFTHNQRPSKQTFKITFKNNINSKCSFFCHLKYVTDDYEIFNTNLQKTSIQFGSSQEFLFYLPFFIQISL